MKTAIAAWLLSALAHWTSVPPVCGQATPDPCDAFARTHYEPAESFYDRIAAWSELIAETADTPRHALDLSAIAFMESGFLRTVDDGTCNTRVVPRRGWVPCDGGKAYTVFQLRPDTWQFPVSGADLLGDPALAASKAWELYRLSPALWATWPRARLLAAAWAYAHPAPAAGT